jgi:CRISPR system Cascade subunit CasC
MKIELHLIQNFAPSCLNRDDTNQPKDCEFGGVRRARISSQCIKRAIRKHPVFGQYLQERLAQRSRWSKDRLREIIRRQDAEPDALVVPVGSFLNMLVSAAEERTADENAEATPSPRGRRRGAPEYEHCEALSWLSDDEMRLIVAWVSEHSEEVAAAKGKDTKRKVVQAFLGAHPHLPFTPDIALFGRMMANAVGMNVDATSQVAHAISTHRVDMDMDFYTAVDDLNPESETGAGMMGVTGFNSACFYRYALVDRGELLDGKHLKGDQALADEVTRGFLLASVYAIPTGKQNSMAAQNLPSFGMFVVRSSGAPCSLVNAFAEPVRTILGKDEDLIGRSIEALTGYWARMQRVYGSDGVLATPLFHDGREDRLGDLASSDKGSVQDAVAATMEAVRAAKGG